MIIPGPTRQNSSTWVLQFINIVFLIMLFFLVGGTIAEVPNAEVAPPIALQNDSASPPQNALYIKADGTMMYLGETLTIESFIARQSSVAQPLTIVADRQLKAHVLVHALSMLRASGISDLVLTTVKSSS